MSIVTECSDGLLRLTLDRADKRNALTRDMYVRLADALLRANEDPAIRVVLLRGAGEHFCAGNDIADFIDANAGGMGDVADSPVGRFLLALNRLSVPLVAAVRGHAVGIGATLLLHADLVLVADDARLSMPFANLALCPEAASSLLLPERIGHARAFAMMALGEVMSGTEAAALGLANRAAPSVEVDDLAMATARALAARPPGALAATKALMRRTEAIEAVMRSEFDAFAARLATPEAAEAFAAFVERRPPDFSRF